MKVLLKTSRTTGKISLFIDSKEAAQWSIDPEDYPKDSPFLAFYTENAGAGSIRISNLVVSEWSGVMDSAASKVNDKRDILLLTNDTDRFSGEITKIEDNFVFVDNQYAPLKISLDNLRTLNFAQSKLKEIEELENPIKIRFYNNGVITGTPVATDKPNTIAIKTRYNQTVDIPVEAILGIEMEEISDLVESWNKKH